MTTTPPPSPPLTIREAAAALRSGQVTALELTRNALALADAIDPDLGCFLARFDETALAAAGAADEEMAAGIDRGPLHGLPIAVKDLLAAKEGPTTAHSQVQPMPARSDVDADAVSRLREAGAVIVGKTTLSEYALGAPSPEAGLPLPRNPWNREHWPGGSSSGTASGVAAGLFLGGLGTDTGGSVRIPAACCGITGLKPTYGLVPRSGCVPLAHSLDTIGPMARTADDCALLLEAISGRSPDDPTSVDPVTIGSSRKLDGDITGLRIGVERRHHGTDAGSAPEVIERVEDAIALLELAGARVQEVEFRHWDAGRAADHVIMHAEAFAHHRRSLRDHWSDFGPLTRILLASGAFLSAGDYIRAQQVRALVRSDTRRLYDEVDVVITPTVGAPVPRLDADFVALVPLFFTGIWNLTGCPAVSVPVGRAQGLPVGMQIAGRPFDDATVLHVGDAYQRRTDWHRAVVGQSSA